MLNFKTQSWRKKITFSTVCTCFRAVNLVLSSLDAYKQRVQDRDAKSHGCAPESAISHCRSSPAPRWNPWKGEFVWTEKKIKNKSLAVVNASGSLLHLECMGSCSLCASGPNTVVLLNKLELETASSWPWAPLCCRQAAGPEMEQPPTQGSLAESWEHQQPGPTQALCAWTCHQWLTVKLGILPQTCFLFVRKAGQSNVLSSSKLQFCFGRLSTCMCTKGTLKCFWNIYTLLPKCLCHFTGKSTFTSDISSLSYLKIIHNPFFYGCTLNSCASLSRLLFATDKKNTWKWGKKMLAPKWSVLHQHVGETGSLPTLLFPRLSWAPSAAEIAAAASPAD